MTLGHATRHRMPAAFGLVPVRTLVVPSPTVRIDLAPGDRALVAAGEAVLPGTPLAERTPDAALVDAGRLEYVPEAALEPSPSSQDEPGGAEPVLRSASGTERRRPPEPGKWWVGGEHRRGRLGRRYQSRRLAGALLFDWRGRWLAAAGERHEIVEAPCAGIVREARNGVAITMTVSGAGIPGLVAAGVPARGHLDLPPVGDGELRPASLDVGRAGAIVLAGSRVDAEGLTRARAMGIRGMVAASIGSADLRDMAASEARQRASQHALEPFAALSLDGYARRGLPAPLMALFRSLAGREVAVLLSPPMLVFDAPELPLPEYPPDWVRIRSGPFAGREGRWVGPAGIRRFRAGAYLEAAFVRLDGEQEVVAVNDLERFAF